MISRPVAMFGKLFDDLFIFLSFLQVGMALLLKCFGLLKQELVSVLNSIQLVNAAVNQIGVNNIFKIGIGCFQCYFCLVNFLKKIVFLWWSFSSD